jgi:hypothetical protein
MSNFTIKIIDGISSWIYNREIHVENRFHNLIFRCQISSLNPRLSLKQNKERLLRYMSLDEFKELERELFDDIF